ncbi:rifin [Plasmodium reichenowi]|uniref:Rifin n=1 Tax=Plasmodium reichenowi TaxID=5854 RepID=A0A060RQY6_PLARE|nr:rifin [Plasmodium reichenowi]
MKLHYSTILLFFLLLNILVTSSLEHNKNKIYITLHHKQIYTSRMLSEKDIQSSIYDKDEEIISVKEIFDRQTSQRFEEYEERMKDKRQKHKEKRDKNIQEIIEKDKMEKNLAEKIEKGCLMCGCGLGGVAASVGIFGAVAVNEVTKAATATAIGTVEKTAAEAGMNALIDTLKEQLGIPNLYKTPLGKFITTENYLNETLIFERVKDHYQSCLARSSTCENNLLFGHYTSGGEAKGFETALENAEKIVREGVEKASTETIRVIKSQMETLEAGELAEITITSTYSYSAIGYSVLAILIIVLIMIIIYLVLRYRRKKKMNKKAQYTKLLKE